MDASVHEPEQLRPTELRDRQSRRLAELVSRIVPANPFWTGKFQQAGLAPADIQSARDLRKLPVTEKAELVRDQSAHPPYGSNLTFPQSQYSRLHQTSGTTGEPLRWLDTPESWNWLMECWAQNFRLAGVTPEDRIAFPFSFGPFLGFWAAFDGANRLGCLCLAGGGMSSQGRLRLILDNAATVVCCTPTYALRLAEAAAEEGLALKESAVRALIVAGECGGNIPATRQRIEEAWGARVIDHWGMTEVGALATECAENPGGLHVLETECIAEIVDPNTLEPVAPGDEGELLITNLGRVGSPLLRFRTGDIVRADTRPCPCGRGLLRLDGGVLGRVDDMFTIRGNNVYPSSLEAILRTFAGVAEYRIEVSTRRAMQHVKIEIEPAAVSTDENSLRELVGAVAGAIKDRLNFNADVAAVPQGSLPRFELKGRRFTRVE